MDQFRSIIFDPKSAFQLLTALVTLVGLIAAYIYWTRERILEMTKEYDELADARKIFWDSIDKAYEMCGFSSNCIPSSSTPTVDSFIRGLLFKICANFKSELSEGTITSRLINCFNKELEESKKQNTFKYEGAREISAKFKVKKFKKNDGHWIISAKIGLVKRKPMYEIINRGDNLYVYYIFGSIYPLGFDPKKILDISGEDLLSNVKRLENKWNDTNDINIKELWKLARFIYPSEEDYGKTKDDCGKIDFSKQIRFETQYLKKFNIARGKLSRFWSKWASQNYSKKEILKNYIGAHEQLIMLTWLELALVRKSNDYGKGKVPLFEIAEEVDSIYKKLTGRKRKN